MRKLTLLRTDAVPCTIRDQKLFKKVWIHTSRRIIVDIDNGGKQGNLQWEEVIGSLTSATYTMNFKPETDMALSCCQISFKFLTTHMLHCW